MYYNFARIHKTLRVTPAMEAGISDHVSGLEEIVGLQESRCAEMTNTNRVMREGFWIIGCTVAATAFCYFAPEYGYSPVPFFSVSFYLLSWLVRVALRRLQPS
jgi:hypothetical protein